MPAPDRPSLSLTLLALAALTVALLSRPAARPIPRPATPDRNAWTVADLLRHLEDRGLHLHARATSACGTIDHNAYLTRRERPWADLCGLVASPSLMDRWEGIVYCECGEREEAKEINLPLWGECGLRADPFVFFGDPGMLAHIHDALADFPECSSG
jgi:hypothetical protein